MNVAGLPTTRGSALWRDDVQVADSELVARYKRAGMVVLGMSNSPELGKNASTEPLLHGPTRNPWNPTYSPGGSSGGSAAAVAAGIVPVAHGNDGGGSIRIPASMCGLFGLKPSRGRISAAPSTSVLSSPMSINHVLTRSVRDSALLLDETSAVTPGDLIGAPGVAGTFTEQMQRDPGRLRIGLVTTRADGEAVDPECVQAVREAAALCEELGHVVTELDWTYDAAEHMSGFGPGMGVGLVSQVDQRLAELGRELRDDDLEPFTRFMYEHYKGSISAVDFYRALNTLQKVSWDVGRMYAGVDLLLLPTMAVKVPELGYLDTSNLEVIWTRTGAFSSLTGIFNTTGQPAVSIPWTTDSHGLPLGIQFAGVIGDEGLLLSLSRCFEEARPWPLLAPGYGS
ncbi:amidase [Nocardioides alcanivorans]|uniref:amidase n=1 Tax=Nocardioides alcanivorans TaxID=2897352 RepID=UPI001EEE2C28|nr:amidase family protein [Nocardioides alcanivorans]